ncbi:hypothetical protein Pelo_16982 [Pelomyxa schiedti]|nr:hypothetical protein Pelo_16982 [Pelomyxa schiedti]
MPVPWRSSTHLLWKHRQRVHGQADGVVEEKDVLSHGGYIQALTAVENAASNNLKFTMIKTIFLEPCIEDYGLPTI